MCGLCGVLGGGAHWADGLTRTGASAVPAIRRAARRRHVAFGNAILNHYGLTLADWQGAAFVLRSRTGSSAMVSSLGDLWAQADTLLKGQVDPLDPALLRMRNG